MDTNNDNTKKEKFIKSCEYALSHGGTVFLIVEHNSTKEAKAVFVAPHHIQDMMEHYTYILDDDLRSPDVTIQSFSAFAGDCTPYEHY